MRPIVADRVASVCPSVCRFATIVSHARTAEPIEMPFGTWTRLGSRKHVLDGDVHWRHLANTIEPSMCGGDAAFCQVTLTTCLSGPPLFLINCPFPCGDLDLHLIRVSSGATRIRSSNGILIGSAVFAWLTTVTDRQITLLGQ